MASGKRNRNVMLLAPDLGYGGAERSFATLTQLLSAHYKIYAVVFNREIKQVYPIRGNLISLDVATKKTLFGKLYGVVQRSSKLRALKRELDIDVCISFLEGADYMNVLSKGRERTILSIRGSKRHDKSIRGFSGWVRRRILLPAVFKKADAVIAVSDGLQQELMEDYKIKTQSAGTIHNYYSLQEMQEHAALEVDENLSELLKKNSCIVTVGRLSSEKGFQQLLEVFDRVSKAEPNLKLIFIGEGEFGLTLKKTCTDKGLTWEDYQKNTAFDFSKNVFFLGYQPEPLSIISKSFLFVLPSLTEGFPNALIEAMAAGVPVVAADCPHGPKEVLGPSPNVNGVLLPHFFEYDNPANQPLYDLWTLEILKVVSDPGLRESLVKSATQRVQDFTEDEALKKWTSWIEV